jgi:hypothetical protein
MKSDSNPSGMPMSNSAKVAERLLAHARLCREIAAQSWNEVSAQRLEELAAACVKAADSTAELLPPKQLH